MYKIFYYNSRNKEDDFCDLIISEIRKFHMTNFLATVFDEHEFNRTVVKFKKLYSMNILHKKVEYSYSLAHKRISFMSQPLISHLQTVTLLDLSYNMISNLDFLVHFKNLTSFICDYNPIDDRVMVPSLPQLQLLWLNYCKINYLFPWIKQLSESCRNLKQLSLMGNLAAPSYFNDSTCYEHFQYRFYVIYLFRNLIHLDDKAITEVERDKAGEVFINPVVGRKKIFEDKLYPFTVALRTKNIYEFFLLQNKFLTVFNNPSINDFDFKIFLKVVKHFFNLEEIGELFLTCGGLKRING